MLRIICTLLFYDNKNDLFASQHKEQKLLRSVCKENITQIMQLRIIKNIVVPNTFHKIEE